MNIQPSELFMIIVLAFGIGSVAGMLVSNRQLRKDFRQEIDRRITEIFKGV